MSMEESMYPRNAGEGMRLPKGLSLFRFFLFAGLMLGAAYGGISLHYSTPPPQGQRAAVGSETWRPSWLWFPAWLALKSGLGVEETERGFIFRSRMGRAFFATSVIIMGILLGGTVGWVTGEWIRKERLRRKAKRTG